MTYHIKSYQQFLVKVLKDIDIKRSGKIIEEMGIMNIIDIKKYHEMILSRLF